jgi:hypothetical protein
MEKFLKLFSTIMLAVIVMPMAVSCSNDEVEEPFDINKAIGTWMCIQSTDTYMGQSYDGLLVGKEITVNKGGTYTSTSYDFGYSGSYTYTGNKITAKNSRDETFVVTVSFSEEKMNWKGTASTGVSFHYIFQKESGN